MSNTFEFMRGDTFDMIGDARSFVEGEPVSFVGTTVRALLAHDDGRGLPDGASFAAVTGEWVDDVELIYRLLEEDTAETAQWTVGDTLVQIIIEWGDGRKISSPFGKFRIAAPLPEPA